MKKIIFFVLFFLNVNILLAQNWTQFGNGAPEIGTFYLDSITNTLYGTGKFVDVNNDSVVSPAYWNGADWIPIGNFDFSNSHGPPYKLFIFDSTLYVGGGFTKAYGAPGDYLLKLNNNNSWDTLNFSPNEYIRSFYEYNRRLYIGGRFTSFGLLSTFGVAIYDPPLWSTIPPVLSGLAWVETMKEYNQVLILAGLFPVYLTTFYYGCIVGWDGFNFIPLNEGLELTGDPYPLIFDLEVYNNKLYVAGDFTATNVSGGSRIVCWDGQVWSSVGNGTNWTIRALQVFNGELYAAGSFDLAGGIPADCIAKWDGNKWCSLGSTFNGSITEMCVYNNELLVCGTFISIDGQPVNHIAKWIGGNFTDSCQVVGIGELDFQNQFYVYPSPTHNILKIKSEKYFISHLKITDLTGKNIYSIENSNTSCQLDITFLGNGLYFLIIETKEGRVVKKFVKE